MPPSEVQVIHNRWNSLLRASGLATIQRYDRESARRWLQTMRQPWCDRSSPPSTTPWKPMCSASPMPATETASGSTAICSRNARPRRCSASACRWQIRFFFRSTEAQIDTCFFATRAGSPFFLRLYEELEGRDLSSAGGHPNPAGHGWAQPLHKGFRGLGRNRPRQAGAGRASAGLHRCGVAVWLPERRGFRPQRSTLPVGLQAKR